jgi:1-deoxyxylulose-5-phosphate synthase
MAKEKKWIRAHGVSCHSLPALRAAVESDWTDVLLVRVNPQGLHVDNEDPFDDWGITGRDVNPVIAQIKAAESKGKGIIGMKIFANGELLEPAEREKSVQFAMSKKEIHAVVIGLASRAEVDEAVERINRALKPA